MRSNRTPGPHAVRPYTSGSSTTGTENRYTGGGAIGYVRGLAGARRAARRGMVATIGLALVAFTTVLTIGWSSGNALGFAAVVLILGCLGSCAAVWLIEDRASHHLQEEVAALARRRAAGDAGHELEDR